MFDLISFENTIFILLCIALIAIILVLHINILKYLGEERDFVHLLIPSIIINVSSVLFFGVPTNINSLMFYFKLFLSMNLVFDMVLIFLRLSIIPGDDGLY